MTAEITPSIKIDQFEVPYRVMGDGPSILCSELPLNPFSYFDLLQKKLAAKYRVFLIDLRPVVGYSEREPPADDLLDFLSDFSLKVMEILGIHEFSLMGSFMFGGVSMDMTRKAPDRVRNLILLSTLGLAPGPMTPMLRFILWFYRLPGFPSLFRFPPFRGLVEWSDHYFIGPRRMYQIFYEPEKISVALEDLYEQYKTPRSASAALALMWCIRKMSYAQLVPRLHQVKCPALIVHGAEDKWIPIHYAEDLHSRLPHSTLVEIPQARHAPEVENVELTHKYIEMFLENSQESLEKNSKRWDNR